MAEKTVAGRRRAFQAASKVGRLWLPIAGFAGLDNDGTNTVSLSEGVPTLEPASGTIELATIPMTTADEAQHIIPIPWDLDRQKDMAARVVYIHASTDAGDQPVWKVGYKFFAIQDQTVEIKAGVDEDVSITSDATASTDDSLEVTDWTRLKTATYMTRSDVMMGLCLELDALGSALADECEVVGVELAYQRNPAAMHFKSIDAFIRENPV